MGEERGGGEEGEEGERRGGGERGGGRVYSLY